MISERDFNKILTLADSLGYGNVEECIGERSRFETVYQCWQCPVRNDCEWIERDSK